METSMQTLFVKARSDLFVRPECFTGLPTHVWNPTTCVERNKFGLVATNSETPFLNMCIVLICVMQLDCTKLLSQIISKVSLRVVLMYGASITACAEMLP